MSNVFITKEFFLELRRGIVKGNYPKAQATLDV